MEQSNGGGGVKVKFIETQFVSSDAANFKSVVQRLTGRDSSAATLPEQDRTPQGADRRVGTGRGSGTSDAKRSS